MTVEVPSLLIRSSTVSELPLHSLPLAVQKTVQLNWSSPCGTSSVPVPGSENPVGDVESRLSGLLKASSLKMSGIAPYAPFGQPAMTVASAETAQELNPRTPEK